MDRLLENKKMQQFLKGVILIHEICQVSETTASFCSIFQPTDGEVKQILLRFKENSQKISEVIETLKDSHKSVKAFVSEQQVELKITDFKILEKQI